MVTKSWYQSKKLWAFVGVMLIVLANYIFQLGMPLESLQYVVEIGAAYILGQGYVDAKQSKVNAFPLGDFTDAVGTIIQSEIEKTGFGKNLHMETILNIIQHIVHSGSSLNVTQIEALAKELSAMREAQQYKEPIVSSTGVESIQAGTITADQMDQSGLSVDPIPLSSENTQILNP